MTWSHQRTTINLINPRLGYARVCSLCQTVRQCLIIDRKTSYRSTEKLHICAHCAHDLTGLFLPKGRKAPGPLATSMPPAAPANLAGTSAAIKRKPRTSKRRRLSK